MQALNNTFSRSISYTGEIVLIDGLTGSGKTIAMRCFSAVKNSHPPIFKYVLEQVCIANYFGKISKDAGVSLVKLIIDQAKYDLAISREINFRFADLSSILKFPNRLRYLQNLFKDDTQIKPESFMKILPIVVHQLHKTSFLIDEALDTKPKRIICMRHPIYLYDHWLSYLHNHGKNPRDFTLTFAYGSEELPWFSFEQKKLYSKSNNEDRTAIAIASLTNHFLDFVSIMDDENTIVMDFEKFVLMPETYINNFHKKISNLDFSQISYILKKEQIPRKSISDGKSMKIYKRYNSEILKSGLENSIEFNSHNTRINKMLSKPVRTFFQKSCERYISTFGNWNY